ncbi:hypothetical protein HMPREF9999_01075 [Alloprevotella sp. oral taxon 473 str. F0040]|nr:hypothetical protein HMPREF9999_01075 [Alloprevotella sp. oral taxon 473 str. F0040]
MKIALSRVRVRAHYTNFSLFAFTTFTEIFVTSLYLVIYKGFSDTF